jgi:transcriptional regulator with GAF, ATPase, and Fis domain
MSTLAQQLEKIRDELESNVKSMSRDFSGLEGKAEPVREDIAKIFKNLLEQQRSINSALGNAMSEARQLETRCNEIGIERDRLKALYHAGVSLNSKAEVESVLEYAMDQVTIHLRAERGFLILIDDHLEREYFVSKNFDGEDVDHPAEEVCQTVIRKTVEALQPLKVDDDSLTESIVKQGSFIKLGLRSVLSVPILYRKQLLGVVYLDRRQDDRAFGESDLGFLIAFAGQIAGRVYELKRSLAQVAEYEKRDKSRLEELRGRFNFSEIIGRSEKLVRVLELAAKVAPSEANVLIVGESGVGKELIARAIHYNSDRCEKRFVAINCGAIPSELLESELFGYEPGAFTGAVRQKPGKFELAHGGTIFLDEIGELSVQLQVKILRVVQMKEIERLGGTIPKQIDIRLIAATNRNLGELVKSGQFREDLYYRLKVVEIELPPLRERRDDIGLLIHHFLNKHSNGKAFKIADEALDVLEQYRWDGNVRELENVIQRAIVLSESDTIMVDDLPVEIVANSESDYRITRDLPLDAAETDFRRWYVLRALRKTNSNKTKAAELLGINRTHFFRMLAQLGISDTD